MKKFYHLLANNVIASIVNFTVWFGIVFFAFLETKSVLVTGVISGLYTVAVAATGIWFGSIVDHNSKKKVMMVSSVLSLAIYVVAYVVYSKTPIELYKDPSNSALWILIGLTMAGVIVGNLRNIALPTLVTILVDKDRRDKANGLVGGATGISFLITSVISGFLVSRGGMYWVLSGAVAFTIAIMGHLMWVKYEEKISVSQGKNQEKTQRIDLRGTFKAVNLIPGLFPLILFTTFNNFLGGVYMALMDAYGLSLVSVEVWGLLWGVLSTGFIIGGMIISKKGLGKNPLNALFAANIVIWTVGSLFSLRSSIVLLALGMYIYMCVFPFIEAVEHTIIQKLVPVERQGRVFGFAQSIEQAASPLTAFIIGPVTQIFFMPFMTDGWGAKTIGGWFGTGPDRGMALVFVITGILGLIGTLSAKNSKSAKELGKHYEKN